VCLTYVTLCKHVISYKMKYFYIPLTLSLEITEIVYSIGTQHYTMTNVHVPILSTMYLQLKGSTPRSHVTTIQLAASTVAHNGLMIFGLTAVSPKKKAIMSYGTRSYNSV